MLSIFLSTASPAAVSAFASFGDSAMSKRYPLTKAVSRAHLTAIGSFVARWARLEADITQATVLVLELDDIKGRVVTAELNINAIQTLLLTGLHTRFGFDHASYVALRTFLSGDAFTQTKAFRNKIVHGVWAQGKQANSAWIIAYKARGKLTTPHEDVTAKYIREQAQKTDDLWREFVALFKRAQTAMPPWPRLPATPTRASRPPTGR